MVGLVDYVGVEELLQMAAGWLDVGVHETYNVNQVGRVFQLIWGRHRASKHLSKERDSGA